MEDIEQQTIFVHTSQQRFGPIFRSIDREIPNHLPDLLKDIKYGRDLDDSIFVVVYPPMNLPLFYLLPDVPRQSINEVELCAVDVYEIPLEKDESVSLEDIRNRLMDDYGREKMKQMVSFTVWRAERESELYSAGSVFTAMKCVTHSLFGVSSASTMLQDNSTICPSSDQPLVSPTEETLSGSGSSEREKDNSSKREGPVPDMVLEHKELPAELKDTSSHLKPHKELEEEPVLNIPGLPQDTPKVVDVDGKDRATQTLLKNQAKPLESSVCPPQGTTQHSADDHRSKTSSNSDLVAPPLKALKSTYMTSGFYVCTALKNASAAALCDDVKEKEEYTHSERFVTALEQQKMDDEMNLKSHNEHDIKSCFKGDKEITENEKRNTQLRVQDGSAQGEEGEQTERENITNQCVPEVGDVSKHVFYGTKSQEFNYHRQLLVGGGGHVTGGQGVLPGQLSGHDQIVVPPMCPVPDELRGDDQAKCVYLQPQSKRQRLLQVCSKGETFPSEQELESVQDTYALIYGEEGFLSNHQLSIGDDCTGFLPPPSAVQALNPQKIFQFAAFMNKPSCTLCDDSQVLHRSAFLGSGGNGITFECCVKGKQYAVKWMRYMPDVLRAWSKFKHRSIVPLLAVVKVDPGCYVIMPRMESNLGVLINNVGDLYSLACCENQDKWCSIIWPNIQHILSSIFQGVAYLHEEGYQHRDLKESNILCRRNCQCANIFCCQCSFEKKCDVLVADFDSLRPFFNQTPTDHHHVSKLAVGTLFYRPPEAHINTEAPGWDMWSCGVLVSSLFHNKEEKNEMRQKSKRLDPISDPRNPSVLPVAEAAYGREMLSSLRSKCISKRDQLEPLVKIAEVCLVLDVTKRVKAQELLDNFHQFIL